MVLEDAVFKYLKGDSSVFESDVLEKLGASGALRAYMHHGFWQCMDTLRDKLLLDGLVEKKKAPWIKW